jgi:hypothetical protein
VSRVVYTHIPNPWEKTSGLVHLRAIRGEPSISSITGMVCPLSLRRCVLPPRPIHLAPKQVVSLSTSSSKRHRALKCPGHRTYYKNHHERLHHYERVARSRISMISDNHPGLWPSEQRIRPVTTDKQAPAEMIRWAITQR